MSRASFILLFALAVINPVSAKDKDRFWICASDDDPRSIFIQHPSKGAAEVRMGGAPSRLSSAEKKKPKQE